MSTGRFAAECANVQPAMTVAVVGDAAVGLLGVLSAARRGAARIIAMSRHASRPRLASEFGATDIVAERGDEGVARIREMTAGVGDAGAGVDLAPGAFVGVVGVPHGVAIPGEDLFSSPVGIRGGPAPARRFLPDLIELVLGGEIDPGKVFDLVLPLDQVAEGSRGDGRAAGHQGPTVAVTPGAAGC